MTIRRVSKNLPSVDFQSKQIDPFVSMTVGSTVGSEFNTTVIETLEKATASIIEVIGNKVILQMTRSAEDIDFILGTSTIELTHQSNNIDVVDITAPEALFENAIINWINVSFDKSGQSLDKSHAEWNGGTANTADATVVWDGTETLPKTGDKYFINITHAYSQLPEGRILWVNSTVGRTGTEYGGLFYRFNGRRGQSFFQWIDPRNDFRKPDAGQTYFVSVQFSMGPEDINASIKGELFRTSFLSADSDGVKEFNLDVAPAATVTRTLLFTRNTANSFDEINTALQQLSAIRSEKPAQDSISPVTFPLETFFNNPTISFVNRRKAELRNTSISPDFTSGSFKWNNLALEKVGATISWGTPEFGPAFGTTYYTIIKPTDQPEELNTVTINWVNEFSDNTGIDFSSTLLFTTKISEAWDANGASDARLQWITTSAQVDTPVIVVNNSDINQGNWVIGTASDYNEVGIRNQDPLAFFPSVTGGTNKIFRLFPSSQDLTNYSKVSFFIKTPRTWNLASPDLVLYVKDTIGGEQTVPFAVTKDNEFTYIIVDITALTRTQVTEIGFQEGSGITSNLVFFVDGFEIRKLHPENGDFFFVNISYVDVAAPLSKINAFFLDGEKKIKTKLAGVNLDRDSVSEPLSTGKFTIDSVGRVVIGDAINPLSKGDNVIVEYHIQTGFQDKVTVNIPKFSRIESHIHIQVPKKSTDAFLEVFDTSENKYLGQDFATDGTVQPFLLGPETNILDEIYLGSEDRFRSAHFHLTQAADFTPSSPTMTISYSSLDAAGNLIWLTTGLTFVDDTSNFTDISKTRISLNFATETDWDNWKIAKTQEPVNQDFTRREIFWLKIEFDISTNGARPRVSSTTVTKFEDFFDTDFRSISSFDPIPGLSTGSFHDEISVLAVRTNMLGLMTPKAEQLDVISNQVDGFSFRNLIEADGDTLDQWGVDLGAPRKGGETDLLYRDRLATERRFLVSSLTGILEYLSFVMDLKLNNLEIRQWWESSWILDINTRLSSSYKFAVQDVVRSATLEDIIIDGILFTTPFLLNVDGTLGKQFFWVSDSIDSTNPVDIIPNGFDLNDNADVSLRPTFIWQGDTKKIVWGETPPAFKIAPTETYHVGFFYIDPDSIPITSLVVSQSEDYFNFLNSFADDLTNILSNSLPIPGWNVKLPLLKNSDSSKTKAQLDFKTTDSSDLSTTSASRLTADVVGDEILLTFIAPVIDDKVEIALPGNKVFGTILTNHTHLGNILSSSVASATDDLLSLQLKLNNTSFVNITDGFKALLSDTDFFVRTSYFDTYILYYKFDGDFKDSSGNGRDGVNSGTKFQTGQFGLAADFVLANSTDVTTPSYANPPNKDNGLSYSFWINITSSLTDIFRVFYSDGEAIGTNTKTVSIYVRDFNPGVNVIYDQGDHGGTFVTINIGGTDFFDGLEDQFQHVVITVDHTAGILKGYVNKLLVNTSSVETALQVFPDANQVKYIGKGRISSLFSEDGLDDFRVINHIVTQDEVNELFNGFLAPGIMTEFFNYEVWLKFDSDVTDFSGRLRNGTNTGVTFGTGQFGSSGVFAVGDFVQLPTYTNIATSTNTGISYSFWFKHPGLVAGTSRMAYTDGATTDTSAKRISIDLSDDFSGNQNIEYRQGGGAAFFAIGFYNGSTGVFVHTVITVDTIAGRIRFYKNKVIHTTSSVDARLQVFPNASNQLKTIGRQHPAAANLDGEVDDFRVINHVLSQTEIDAIFNNNQEIGGVSHIVYNVPPSSPLLTSPPHTITIKALTSERITILESGDKVNVPFSPDKSRLIAAELFGRKVLAEDQIFDRFTDLTINDWSNPTNTDVELDTINFLKDGSSMKIQTIDSSSNGEIVIAPSTGAIAFDASVYDGVSFFAMSTDDTGVKIELEIVFEAGAPDLTFTYPIEFQETETWEFFKFPFNLPTTLKDEIKSIGFRMRNGSALITFHIDDFQFFQEQNFTIAVHEEDSLNPGLPDPDELKLTKTFKKEEFPEFPIESSIFWIRSSNDGTPMIPVLFTEDKDYVVVIENTGNIDIELLHEDFTSSSNLERNLFVMNRNKKELEGGKVNTNPETDIIYEDFKGILQKRKPASTFAEAEFVILD